MTPLSDNDLKWLALAHLGARAEAYIDFIDTTDFSGDTDTTTKFTVSPYDAKLFFLLAAAHCHTKH
jgi:hypothetical protein